MVFAPVGARKVKGVADARVGVPPEAADGLELLVVDDRAAARSLSRDFLVHMEHQHFSDHNG